MWNRILTYFACFVIGTTLILGITVGDSSVVLQKAKNAIPRSVRTDIKENLSRFRNYFETRPSRDEYERQIQELNAKLALAAKRLQEQDQQPKNNAGELERLQSVIDHQIGELEKKDLQLTNIARKLEGFEYSKQEYAKVITLNDRLFKISKFTSDILLNGKHTDAVSTAYLDSTDQHLLIAYAVGIFGFVDLSDTDAQQFRTTTIPSNFIELVGYTKFLTSSKYGIKDILISDNNLYVSYSNQASENCFNTAVAVAGLNLEYLDFRKLYEPSDCVKRKNDYGRFNPHVSGGRLAAYDSNQLLFSTGTFQYRTHAQDRSNDLGKVVAIDTRTGESELISMGHRNPQGLFFDEDKNTVLMTEHGPFGGDEININASPGGEVENYGWPISSYGEHYGFDQRDDDSYEYVTAPLYKSHIEHGFVEPALHFPPGMAISQILQVPTAFHGDSRSRVLVASMGSDPKMGAQSIHHFLMDESYALTQVSIVNLEERIRDMIYVKQLNSVVLFLESTGSIGIIKEN